MGNEIQDKNKNKPSLKINYTTKKENDLKQNTFLKIFRNFRMTSNSSSNKGNLGILFIVDNNMKAKLIKFIGEGIFTYDKETTKKDDKVTFKLWVGQSKAESKKELNDSSDGKNDDNEKKEALADLKRSATQTKALKELVIKFKAKTKIISKDIWEFLGEKEEEEEEKEEENTAEIRLAVAVDIEAFVDVLKSPTHIKDVFELFDIYDFTGVEDKEDPTKIVSSSKDLNDAKTEIKKNYNIENEADKANAKSKKTNVQESSNGVLNFLDYIVEAQIAKNESSNLISESYEPNAFEIDAEEFAEEEFDAEEIAAEEFAEEELENLKVKTETEEVETEEVETEEQEDEEGVALKVVVYNDEIFPEMEQCYLNAQGYLLNFIQQMRARGYNDEQVAKHYLYFSNKNKD